jgi:hypothetical protein
MGRVFRPARTLTCSKGSERFRSPYKLYSNRQASQSGASISTLLSQTEGVYTGDGRRMLGRVKGEGRRESRKSMDECRSAMGSMGGGVFHPETNVR